MFSSLFSGRRVKLASSESSFGCVLSVEFSRSKRRGRLSSGKKGDYF